MISDDEIDQIFEEFLAAPELTSWESDLTLQEREDAGRLFRKAVREAIDLDRG